MANGHDHSVVCFGADNQLIRQAFRIDDQGVVAHGAERIFHLAENGARIMRHLGELAMHDRRRAHDLATKRRADRLVTQTDPENWYARGKTLDGVARDPGFPRCARARRDDDFFRLERFDFVERNLVVKIDSDVGAKLSQIMIQVVGERIIVVDEENHLFLHCSANSTAFSMARALLRVSWYSSAGSESATMPAPAVM